ncbi:hypothetical protein Y032_0010g984 [Ancylostoma ceylanicum]|nr:hypothetical protein Y032_0010g984 [Ancylostoma ceylanicum]
MLRERRHRGASRRVVMDQNVAKTRIATLNVGTLTGRSHELAAALQRRRIDLCAVQETRWSGRKSKDIGGGFKIVYNGSSGTRNGVGVIVSERFRDFIAGTIRLTKIVIVTLGHRIHFFLAYAPQTECTDQAKDEFWALIDEKTAAVPPEDTLIIAGDLNGHVGASKDGYRYQGGLRIRGAQQRWRVHTRLRDQKLVTDAKVVPYKVIVTQPRPLICTMIITPLKQKYDEKCGPSRIKWWQLKEKKDAVISRISLHPVTTVEETWQHATRVNAEVL